MLVLTLSQDTEWAENHAIRVTTDAFGVSVETTDSNSERVALLLYYRNELHETSLTDI